uniref:4-nitrophenylphosphatase n=1 Tax=Syphacia muris TaxID=451379 RepID=A0A0N5AI76_9BILA
MPKVEGATGLHLLNNFDFFLFDADGVLWLGDNPLAGTVEFLKCLVEKGKCVFIITNNATKTIDEYFEKCQKIGFYMLTKDHIVSPCRVLAHVLSKEKSELPVYLVGSPSLQKELKSKGIESFGPGPDPVEKYTSSLYVQDIDVSRPVRAVVVSYDLYFNYIKAMKAANYIKQSGVKFYGTNTDATFPGPNPGVRIPGTGMNVAAVEYVAGKKAIIIGKPGALTFEYIRDKFNISPNRTVMFGDRCDTDIKFGKDNGVKTVLIGTGVHNLDNVRSFKDEGRTDLVPDFYSPSINYLYETIS